MLIEEQKLHFRGKTASPIAGVQDDSLGRNHIGLVRHAMIDVGADLGFSDPWKPGDILLNGRRNLRWAQRLDATVSDFIGDPGTQMTVSGFLSWQTSPEFTNKHRREMWAKLAEGAVCRATHSRLNTHHAELLLLPDDVGKGFFRNAQAFIDTANEGKIPGFAPCRIVEQAQRFVESCPLHASDQFKPVHALPFHDFIEPLGKGTLVILEMRGLAQLQSVDDGVRQTAPGCVWLMSGVDDVDGWLEAIFAHGDLV